MGRASNLFLGCAGWSYEEWVGPLYDSDRSMLQQYSAIFDTAEMDSSFYRPPTKGLIVGLTRYARKGFTLTAKLHRKFTHDYKLNLNPQREEELYQFLQLFDPLLTQDMLGCILIQLPPSLRYDPQSLERFLSVLPHGYSYVTEFRHKSWLNENTWKTLARYEVGYCIVDEPLLPPEIHITSPTAYFRWHGRGDGLWYDYRYTKRQLEDWIPKIQEARRSAKKTFGIFNNHFHGYAPENCLQTMQMLGVAEPLHVKALERIERYLAEEKRKTRSPTLDSYRKS